MVIYLPADVYVRSVSLTWSSSATELVFNMHASLLVSQCLKFYDVMRGVWCFLLYSLFDQKKKA